MEVAAPWAWCPEPLTTRPWHKQPPHCWWCTPPARKTSALTHCGLGLVAHRCLEPHDSPCGALLPRAAPAASQRRGLYDVSGGLAIAVAGLIPAGTGTARRLSRTREDHTLSRRGPGTAEAFVPATHRRRCTARGGVWAGEWRKVDSTLSCWKGSQMWALWADPRALERPWRRGRFGVPLPRLLCLHCQEEEGPPQQMYVACFGRTDCRADHVQVFGHPGSEQEEATSGVATRLSPHRVGDPGPGCPPPWPAGGQPAPWPWPCCRCCWAVPRRRPQPACRSPPRARPSTSSCTAPPCRLTFCCPTCGRRWAWTSRASTSRWVGVGGDVDPPRLPPSRACTHGGPPMVT